MTLKVIKFKLRNWEGVIFSRTMYMYARYKVHTPPLSVDHICSLLRMVIGATFDQSKGALLSGASILTIP